MGLSLDRTKWAREKIFLEADHFYEHLVAEIRHARKTIDLETFTFLPDVLGEKILSKLIFACNRGVKVRLLLDGWGISEITEKMIERLELAGATIRFFNPLPWKKRTLRNYNPLSALSLINNRNHRKSCIIDGEVAYIGSINIEASHSRQYSCEDAWKYCGVRVEGQHIIYIQRAFERSFYQNKSKNILFCPKEYKSSLVKWNCSDELRAFKRNEVLERIRSAKNRIWLTSPYLVPANEMIEELSLAAKKGVDVRILTPKKNDMKLFPYFNAISANELREKGISVFLYNSKFIHAKIKIIDDWYTVGSTNLNQRSSFHDLELDVVVTHRSNQKSLLKQFKADLEESELFIDNSHFSKDPVWRIARPLYQIAKPFL